MFEYIMSGVSMTNLQSKPWFDRLVLVELAKDILAQTNEHRDSHKLGLLYNALTEKSAVNWITPYSDSIKSIHTDSGGLQMMHQGKTITPKIAEDIFKVQAQASHIAMSFDSIPIKIVGVGSGKIDMSVKKFEVSRNVECGITSGKYVQQQIEYFKNNRDTSLFHTKPLIVIQGNSKQDFIDYFEAIKSQISPENYKEIGGFAIAGSAIGIGVLEVLDSCYAFDCLDIPPEMGRHLHFLGYGSVSRLLPIIMLKRNGMFSEYTISYDSTSHSSRFIMGGVIEENLKVFNFGTESRSTKSKEIFGKVYDRFEEHIKKHLNVTRDEWNHIVTENLSTSKSFYLSPTKDQNNIDCCRAVRLCASLYSVQNFISVIDRCIDDVDYKYESSKISGCQIIKYLEKHCNSGDLWYNSYRSKVINYLKSNRIERIESDHSMIFNLDSFF